MPVKKTINQKEKKIQDIVTIKKNVRTTNLFNRLTFEVRKVQKKFEFTFTKVIIFI